MWVQDIFICISAFPILVLNANGEDVWISLQKWAPSMLSKTFWGKSRTDDDVSLAEDFWKSVNISTLNMDKIQHVWTIGNGHFPSLACGWRENRKPIPDELVCSDRARGQFRGNEVTCKVYGKTLMDADLPRMAGYMCVENVSTSSWALCICFINIQQHINRKNQSSCWVQSEAELKLAYSECLYSRYWLFGTNKTGHKRSNGQICGNDTRQNFPYLSVWTHSDIGM